MIDADLLIIGGGAAGLAAGIFAGEAARERGRPLRIVVLETAKKPGAKILVSGGGRCNVTNERITPEDFNGGPRPIIRNVMRAFDERRTLDWMRSLGVELKLEPTGKYFPTTDNARTVLNALLARLENVGVELHHPVRVTKLRAVEGGFEILVADDGQGYRARRLILATGGQSLPRSGSDGAGLAMARRLGHTLIPTTPALVPLLLAPDGSLGGRFAEWSGLTLDLRLGLYDSRGRCLHALERSTLFTHFGLSGPAAMDISRHWLRARLENPAEPVTLCAGHPSFPTPEQADAWLLAQAKRHPRRAVAQSLMEFFPERLARAFAEGATDFARLTRERRAALARSLTRLPLPGTGDRGWSFAETTAGGVELREIDARTMASRVVPDLYLCGEMLDVDGRIGGFNFQWAWASGYLAGRGAVAESKNSSQ